MGGGGEEMLHPEQKTKLDGKYTIQILLNIKTAFTFPLTLF